MSKDEIVPVRMEKEEREKLEDLAREQGIGISTLIRLLVREYLAEKVEEEE